MERVISMWSESGGIDELWKCVLRNADRSVDRPGDRLGVRLNVDH